MGDVWPRVAAAPRCGSRQRRRRRRRRRELRSPRGGKAAGVVEVDAFVGVEVGVCVDGDGGCQSVVGIRAGIPWSGGDTATGKFVAASPTVVEQAVVVITLQKRMAASSAAGFSCSTSTSGVTRTQTQPGRLSCSRSLNIARSVRSLRSSSSTVAQSLRIHLTAASGRSLPRAAPRNIRLMACAEQDGAEAGDESRPAILINGITVRRKTGRAIIATFFPSATCKWTCERIDDRKEARAYACTSEYRRGIWASQWQRLL